MYICACILDDWHGTSSAATVAWPEAGTRLSVNWFKSSRQESRLWGTTAVASYQANAVMMTNQYSDDCHQLPPSDARLCVFPGSHECMRSTTTTLSDSSHQPSMKDTVI
jgi:hypothetical protein